MPDRITAMAFDTAVMTWGVFVENRLADRNEDGQPIWTLEQLLGQPEDIDNAANFAALVGFMGRMSV